MQPDQFRNEASSQDKAQRTKALLMDAAIAVFAKRGVDGASIAEITAHANLANGTFYYHYKDKKEFVEAFGHAVATMFVDRVDEFMNGLTDGAERVATGTQQFIQMAAANTSWGWMIFHALTDLGEFGASISRGIRKDVALGMEQGYFQWDPSDTAFGMLLSVVGSGLKARLENPTMPRIEHLTSECVLRMLGLPPARARALVATTAARIEKAKRESAPVPGKRQRAAQRTHKR